MKICDSSFPAAHVEDSFQYLALVSNEILYSPLSDEGRPQIGDQKHESLCKLYHKQPVKLTFVATCYKTAIALSPFSHILVKMEFNTLEKSGSDISFLLDFSSSSLSFM